MSLIDAEERERTLILTLKDRIDSSNAAQAESEIFEAAAKTPHDTIVLDAACLKYISSAGLRVILRLLKSEHSLSVINASSEVYEIFEMTGFTEMIPVSKAYRTLSVDGCEVIGQGAKGTVYRYNGDTIVKVYKNSDCLPDIQNERALAKRAFVLGIPTAISYDVVKVGENYGSVFEMLNAKSYSEIIVQDSANRDRYISDYAGLLKKIHEITVKPEDMPDVKTFVMQWFDLVSPYLSAPAAEKLGRLLREVPDVMTMLHCDYHTNNVMRQDGQAFLIDMDTLSHGHPIFELANIYVTYVGFGELDPTVVENFLEMPYALAKEIWRKTIAIYLETDDESRIAEVENKVRIVSYLRLMRHRIRSGGMETEKGKQDVAYYRAQLETLLKHTDTLTF